MRCFMCVKVVDAGQQQLSMLLAACKILKCDVASDCCGGPEEDNGN